MPLTYLLAALLTATTGEAVGAPSPPQHIIDEKERVELDQTDHVRLSLPTQSDREAWSNPGLRVQLGYGYTFLHGVNPAWSFRSQSVLLRPSVRIDPNWALGVTVLYGTGPGGLRWSVTAEPTFFPWRQLAVSVGMGFGGLLVSNPGAPTGRLQGPTEAVSRNLADDEKLQSCSGSALTSLLRGDYLFIAGPLFASGPFAQVSAQWTRCEVSFGRIDQETGKPVVLTQWWQHEALTFGWWFAWR